MSSHFDIDSLRSVLDQLRAPESLDAHTWIHAAFVKAAVAQNPEWEQASPGKQLAYALETVFESIQPSVPPRRGKRLDTNWGEFGLLAALYFAPLKFGTMIPNSLRDAWGRIDQSILLYVFGRAEGLTEEQVQTFKLVGNESDVAPNSTLSDWHRKGMQQLAAAIEAREKFVQDSSSMQRQAGIPGRGGAGKPSTRANRKVVRRVLLVLLLLLIVWGGFKAWRIYSLATAVWDDVNAMRGMGLTEPDVAALQTAGPKLSILSEDFHALRKESEIFLWLGPLFGWVPEYGGDIASARNLVIMADSMLSASDKSYQALAPLLDVITNTNSESGFDSEQFAEILKEAQPQLIEAQELVEEAVQARERIDLERLSPRAREAMTYADKALPWMRDGLVIALEFPRMMGASDEGPKTYLLLAQNEDELRPTGGFISAAGTLLLQDGQIGSLTFQDSGSLDNWTKAYPSAPWQLHQYMNSEVLVLRDTNWFADYPTAVLYAESLYAYQNDHSVDGVIAMDQHVLVQLLSVTGPVNVEGSTEAIDASNVVAYMRAQKVPPGGESNPNSVAWDSKAFINKLTGALLERILGGGFQWEQLARVVVQALDEKHILLQFDNPALTPILVRRGWDGAVRPGTSDFLMTVDFNMGFNKTNAVVEKQLSYEVDLSNLESPGAQLRIAHTNSAVDLPCVAAPYMQQTLNEIEKYEYFESDYPIDRCYWGYVRIYGAPGTELLAANPQSIPGESMIRGLSVPPQVDALGREEEIQGVQGFGFLKLVPGGETVETTLRFGLPASIVQKDADGAWMYQLRVQKQPGTIAVPFTLRIQLPAGAVIRSMPQGAVFENGLVILETDLRVDLELTVVFTVP